MRFNPYYYWLVIFTEVDMKLKRRTKKYSFNPYYYWLVIFTCNKQEEREWQ